MQYPAPIPRRFCNASATLPALFAYALALAAAPAQAVPRHFLLEGSKLGDTLILDPDRIVIIPWFPEGNRYEQSGDFKERKGVYRVAAYENYYARIGAYEGRASETFIERRQFPNEAPTILEADVTITLGTPEGDSAQIQFAASTTVWEAGFGGMENTWSEGENVNTNGRYLVTFRTVDPGMRREYPWPDAENPTALREAPRRLVLDRSSGLRLEPPAWARQILIHTLTGSRVFTSPLEPGKPVGFPAWLSARGPLYVHYL